ncbi:MAG: invasion associated locus B family protein [Rhizobiales bacterium]|nr:invasion associated locus B family protein [Hyphomicrobiales bacterium]
MISRRSLRSPPYSSPAPCCPPLALAQATPFLPGGASSLQETYQDWQVACRIANGTRLCAISQQQTQQNGQRVLAIELAAPRGSTVSIHP